MDEKRPAAFYLLAAFFTLFVLFLYGPTITIAILSFQGPEGGLTFPMRGVSTHWFHELFAQQAVGDESQRERAAAAARPCRTHDDSHKSA